MPTLRNQLTQLLRATTTLYLLVPSFLFAAGWLRLRYMVIELLVLGVVAIALVREIYTLTRDLIGNARAETSGRLPWKPVAGIGAALCLLGIWTMLSGTGGFGLQNVDYRASNSLLRDLIVRDWPLKAGTVYSHKYVVYGIGYYLPAAALGKVLGWAAANYFMLLWTLIGVGLTFAWFVKLSRIRFQNRPRRYAALAAFFCLAGGLDLIGYYVLRSHPFQMATEIEWWADYFQYSANTTLLYWVPQYAIAAWLVTGLVTDALADGRDIRYLGPACACTLLWSPFGALGIAPYLLVLLLISLGSPERRAMLLNRGSLLLNGLSIWIAAIHVLYLSANAFQFSAGPIWEFVSDRTLLAWMLLQFWLIEFALLAGLITLYVVLGISSSGRSVDAGSRRQEWAKSLGQVFDLSRGQLLLFSGSVALLTVLPLFRAGFYNDLVMRASIPALFIFWACVAKVIADASPPPKLQLRLVRLLILATVLVGFFPAVSQISWSAQEYHWGAPNFSGVLDFDHQADFVQVQRTGYSSAFFFRNLGK